MKQTKKKRRWIIGIIVVIILTVGAYFLHKHIVIASQNADLMHNAAVECSSMKTVEGKDNCYWDYAFANHPATKIALLFCNNIVSSMKYDCTRSVATEANDISICGSIPDSIVDKNLCYSDIAFTYKKAPICENIPDSTLKKACHDCVSGAVDKSLCTPVNKIPGLEEDTSVSDPNWLRSPELGMYYQKGFHMSEYYKYIDHTDSSGVSSERVPVFSLSYGSGDDAVITWGDGESCTPDQFGMFVYDKSSETCLRGYKAWVAHISARSSVSAEDLKNFDDFIRHNQ